MKRKFLSMALAAVLATTMLNVPVTAYAGDAKAEDTADDDRPTELISGSETIGEEQSIDVTSKEVGNEHKIIYSVEISWGAMNFEYNYGSAWDPATHTYTSAQKEGAWKISCLDGVNNRIYVKNNSNYPVSASLSYEMEQGRFNASASNNSVRGVFCDANDDLRNNVNSTTRTSAWAKTGTIVQPLASADETNAYTKTQGTMHENVNGGKTDWEMFFGFWGVPDKDKAQKDGAKAGTITVSVKPYQK